MTTHSIDGSTGNLLSAGRAVFPIGLSDGPPVGGRTPVGGDAWAEIARAGVTFVRNYTVWQANGLDEQLASVGAMLDAARSHRLQVWLALAGVDKNLAREAMLDRIVQTFKPH